MSTSCPVCGLDPEQLSVADAADLVGGLGPRYRAAFATAEGDLARLRAKPDPDVWSPLEYVVHLRDAVRYHGWLANRALTEDRPDVPAPDPDAVALDESYNDADPDEVLDSLTRQSERFAERARGMSEVELDRMAVRVGTATTVRSMIRNVAHEGHHHLQDVERLLA